MNKYKNSIELLKKAKEITPLGAQTYSKIVIIVRVTAPHSSNAERVVMSGMSMIISTLILFAL